MATVQKSTDSSGLAENDLTRPACEIQRASGHLDLWQARATGSWRFYFQIEGDAYHLIDLTPHPK